MFKIKPIRALLGLSAIAAIAAAIAISAVTPSPTAIEAADRAENEFVNPKNGARVFIGTGGVRFGDAENLSVYLYDARNGDLPVKVTVSFAVDSNDQSCWSYIQKYTRLLEGAHNQPGVVPNEHYGELVLKPDDDGIYHMYGPASKDPLVRRNLGDNQPECFAEMAGLAVMLHDGDGNLLHVWNPQLQPGKTAYQRSNDGNALFFLAGYVKVKYFEDATGEPPPTRFSKVDGEWIPDVEGTHARWANDDAADHYDMVDKGQIVDPFVDWKSPLPFPGYNLTGGEMHIQGR